MSERNPPNPSGWRNAAWMPAVLLITVQIAAGLRDLPQSSFFLIFLQEQLHLEKNVISSVVAGAQVTGMLTALLGGGISSRLGSKWVLVLGLALTGLNSLAFQVRSPWLAALLWFIGGAGGALIAVGGASYLTHIGARGSVGILAAFYALSMTAGGAIGNPLAGVLIERSGFGVFSLAAMAVSAAAVLLVILLMPALQNQAARSTSPHSFWSGVLATTQQKHVRMVLGLRCLPTIFYSMMLLLIPLAIYALTGNKVTVAAYGTTNLVIASAAQLLAGRAADHWGARRPTMVAYSGMIIAGAGLAVFRSTLWGLYVFGVLGIAAAWSLSTLMYVWVNDGIPKSDHPSVFGLLTAVWSLSMICGSVFGGWTGTALPWLPFLVGAALNAAALILLSAYYKSTRLNPVIAETVRGPDGSSK
ncbi:MAG TPA: MFS transporter [Anaerolineaceae bacterium]